MTKAPILGVNNLSHTFTQSGKVLDNICLSIDEGQKLALVGVNGAGKSTLLQLLVGLIAKQSGDILLRGKAISSEADFVSLRQHVGLVFQDADDQLFCPSVLEDVMFGPLNQGLSVSEAERVALQILERFNLSHLAQRIASELSGGEKRLLTVACVLVMQPCLLLLDEPTNGLDNQAKADLLSLLQGLDQAMLIISHDQDFVEQLAAKVLTLENGQLKFAEGE